MDTSIIDAIFSAYLDNKFEGVQTLSTDDLQAAYAKLNEFEKKHNISETEHIEFEDDVLSEIFCTCEHKGFINGFRLAVRLFTGK